MKHALMSPQTDYAMRPDRLAREAEARGFESLWFPDHSHIPASRRTPHPQGIELPKDYWHLLDPFACVNAAAAVTTKLKLGTGVLLVCERDPISTAKEVATADFLSKGRFLFGIGGGWNLEEMGKRPRSSTASWCASIRSGRSRSPCRSLTRPSFSAATERRHGSASSISATAGSRFRASTARTSPPAWSISASAKAAGRNPRSIAITVFWAPPDRKTIDGWEDVGVDRVIYALPAEGDAAVLRQLDELARFAAL